MDYEKDHDRQEHTYSGQHGEECNDCHNGIAKIDGKLHMCEDSVLRCGDCMGTWEQSKDQPAELEAENAELKQCQGDHIKEARDRQLEAHELKAKVERFEAFVLREGCHGDLCEYGWICENCPIVYLNEQAKSEGRK